MHKIYDDLITFILLNGELLVTFIVIKLKITITSVNILY